MCSEAWTAEIARTYDDDVAEMYSWDVLGPTVDLLERLSSGGRVL